MKNLIISFSTVALFATILISSCKKEDDDHHEGAKQNSDYINDEDCTASTPTYTADVAPITETKCAISGCHDAASASHGLILEGYDAAKNNFNAHNLLCAINHGSGCDPHAERAAQAL